jgi:hypothetical protein
MVSVERKAYQRKAFSAKKNERKAHFGENAQQRKVKLRNAK